MSIKAVGIDLGTTNCAMASVSLQEKQAEVKVFAVPQMLHASEVGDATQLPSFLYLPLASEVESKATALPWDASRDFAVGSWARDRGAQVPGRVVSSAKSWLSHDGVDRRGPVLPWQSADDIEKLSPLEVTTRYLRHLREVWDLANPEAPLAEQEVVVTVPASFDAVARGLTEEAAHQAGLNQLSVLEEPQAAVYSWIASASDWRKQVNAGDVILVCDVGGGTTDFSLISVTDDGGSLGLDRLAVGDHILLGGDNMDLALAYQVKTKLEQDGRTLDDWQLRAATASAREAKESLLDDTDVSVASVVVPGRGRKLIGGTLRTELSRDAVLATVLDGFLPQVALQDVPASPRRMGLSTLGLPYAADAAITRHLAAFLNRNEARPTCVLFNGGVTRSRAVAERVTEQLGAWFEHPIRVLEGADPDLAVARGAASYARARSGRGIRIKGGTARSYYVGIERAGLAVPGMPVQVDAICVAPFGMEEGSDVVLNAELGLLVGEPASFRFFSSANRQGDQLGDAVVLTEVEELPPIETTLDGENGKMVPVNVCAHVTEVGTLALSVLEVGSDRRWKLEFNIRVQ